jgi:diadenosine tetraphosphate (Ap4A) HIT family hydrolase
MLYYRANVKHREKLQHQDIAQKRSCPFCDVNQLEDIPEENSTMRVIRNRKMYDLFEGVKVEDHLMITPKHHRENFASFTKAERDDYFSLLASYESNGYSVYSRGVGSKTRSIKHLHTHLLLLTTPRVKAMLYLDAPYMVLHPGRFKKVNKIQG